MKQYILTIASLFCIYANAATVYVANDGAHISPFDTWAKAATDIQIAINNALPGDTVLISNGHYYANIAVHNKSLTISGLDTEKTVIDGRRSNSVISVYETVGIALENLSLTRGLGAAGGGLAVYDSQLSCRECNFVTNEAGLYGGGVYVSNSTVSIENSNITWNQVTAYAGSGLSSHHSDLILTNSTISKNKGAQNIIELSGGAATITGSRVSENETFQSGFTLYADACDVTIDSSRFYLNQNNEGAVLHFFNCAANVINSFIARNYGLGVQTSGASSDTILNHCTLFANALGGIQSLNGSSGLSILHSILWNNGNEVDDAFVSYSCVQGGDPGAGNIDSDPLMTYRGYLSSASPCIDAITNSATVAYDINGEQRTGFPDMGADEWVNSDADVLPDWWELLWGFSLSSPDNSEAIADHDGDTYSAQQEYLWGTGPLNRWAPESHVNSQSKEELETGSTNFPYKTLGAALNNTTKANLIIAPGTYSETERIPLQAGEFMLTGNSEDPPVVNAPDNGDTTIQAFALMKLEIHSITFSGQEASGQGRAVHVERGELVMRDCSVKKIRTFMNNGGGIYGKNAIIDIDDCRLYENEGFKGGGIALLDCLGTVSDCVFSENSAAYGGGGIYLTNSPIAVLNCIIMNNETFYDEGSGILVSGAGSDFQNCIVWNNHNVFGPEIQVHNADLNYSCIENGSLQNGNITNYPHLTPDFFLTHMSACIDSGTNNPAAGPDINDELRPINGITDIGIDEWFDSDGDYLPDWWELKWNFPTNRPNGNDDTDLDGIPNVIEYRDGTLPVNTNVLSIIGATNLVARATKGLTNFVFVLITTNGYNGITCTTAAAPGSEFDSVGVTGIFSWVPTPEQVGTWSNVVFETSDDVVSASNVIAITVLQTNRAPVFASISSRTIGEGQLLSFDFSATDIDGDKLHMVCSNAFLPGSRIIPISNGCSRFQWVPPYSAAGIYSDVFFGAHDAEFWAAMNITITVTNIVHPPTHPSVKINNDAGYTNNSAVMLNLFANDAEEMRVGNDVGSLGAWQPYGVLIPWNLAGSEGDNYVHAQFRTSWGDISTTVVDSIQIDITHPTCTALFPPDGWTTNGIPELSWTGSDTGDGSGVGKYELNTNGNVFVVAVDTFLCDETTQGSNSWRVRAIDRAGNSGQWTEWRWFYFDSSPPLNPSVSIEDIRGNGWIAGSNVTLKLSAVDATPMQMRIGNLSDVSDGTWEPYANEKSWVLPGNEGDNTVYTKYRDTAMMESDVASDTIGIDNGLPGIVALAPTQTWTWGSVPVEITWTAQDSLSGVSGLWVEINGTSTFTIDSPYRPVWPHEQTNEWRVRTIDQAGNQTEWSAYRYVGFDTNTPVVDADVIIAPDQTAAWVWGGYGNVEWKTNAITDWSLSETPIGVELMLGTTFERIPVASNLENTGETVVRLPFYETDEWILVILTVEDNCGNTAEEYSEAFQIVIPEPGSVVMLLSAIMVLRGRWGRNRTKDLM